MSSKEDILARCRQNTKNKYDRPSLDDLNPLTFKDPLGQFIITCGEMGASVVEAGGKEEIDAILKKSFPDAKVICSNIPEVKSATLNPDTVKDVDALNGTDIGVVEGSFGVAENACIWIEQKVKEKAVCFISENLVIILSKKEIVSNMHQGYEKVCFNDYGYGVFISGPSKTADIAQVLVVGAQAARTLTVVLIP